MSEENGRPPIVEYSKSSRAGCRGCQEKIEKGLPRIGIPSTFTREGGREIRTYQFYHPSCLYPNQLLQYREELRNEVIPASNLTADDKKQVLKDLESPSSEQDKRELKPRPPYFETSKSGRGKCQECSNKIEEGIVRVARREGEVLLPDGRKILGKSLYHVGCFFRISSEDPQKYFQRMVKDARNKAILSNDEVSKMENDFIPLFDAKVGIEQFVESIGNDPVTINQLKKLAEDQNLDFQHIFDIIKREAEKGKIFISGKTVQRL